MWQIQHKIEMINISERNSGKVVVLDLTGKLTGSEHYSELSKKVEDLLERGDILFVFNMRDISNADSTGIGELIVCLKRVRERGGDIKIANPSQKLESLLRITNLQKIFDIYSNEQAALRSFGH
ncbi:MAG: STAS domain-containing protein [Blastocatellia bacterium]|nr:STAS domain-containing protein [Blastocatellia bacterium]